MKDGLFQAGLTVAARRLALYWILPIAVLAVWYSVTAAGLVQDYAMPSPVKVLQTAGGMVLDGSLAAHLAASIFRVLEGFLLASFCALAVGVTAGLVSGFDRLTDLVLQILKPIPPIAWIPLAILWFGIEEASKIYIIFIGAFFPVFLNTLNGIRNIDKKYLELSKVYEVPRWRVIRKVILPGALPFIMTGLRLGLSGAWICVVAAEMIAAVNGVGYMLMDARSLSRPDIVILGMLLIGLIGKLMDDGVLLLEKKLICWR